MNQHPDDKQLALYAGGDLSEKDAQIVEQHIGLCPVCTETLVDLRRTRQWLRMAQVEPTREDLDDVRMRVMAALPAPQAGWRWWRWLSAGAVAAIMAVFLRPVQRPPVTPRRAEHAQVSAPVPTRHLEERPIAQARVVRPHTAIPRRLEAGLRHVELVTVRGAPEALRMTTANPDVVILLQMGEKKVEDE
jgi:hypothetical protein